MAKKADPWEKYVIKDEDLVMKLGDHVRLIAPVDLNEWEQPTLHLEPDGQIYRAYDRKGAGWDLELISGNGPPHIRALNGDVLIHFEILPQDGRTPAATMPTQAPAKRND